MEVTNLGWKTNIAVLGDGAVQTDDHGDLVVRMDSRRGFYWGNFLLLAKAPQAQDVDQIIQRYQALFPTADYGHIAIGWHEPDLDATQPFLDRGFQLDHCHVSTSSAVPFPIHPCSGLEVLADLGDDDWEATVQMSLGERAPIHDAAAFERFVRKQVEVRRRQVAAGLLTWFVARLEDQVVGSMGLFVQDGVGRFQDVATHRDFRGRGVCSTLLSEVCRRGIEQLGAEQLVLLADVDGAAWRIYLAHGFEARDAVCGVWLPPPA